MSNHKVTGKNPVQGNPPRNPPDGTYSSNVSGDLASWSGTFTYASATKAITYVVTATGIGYPSTNTSNGNAFVFSITVGTTTVTFTGANFTNPNGKAVYSGSANDHKDPTAGQDPWVATQGN